MNDSNRTMPISVVRRLTRYLAFLESERVADAEWVSSHEVAKALGLTSSTVRQDLSHVDFSGTSKRGYRAAGLRDVLAEVLGADTTWTVIVIGAGNLGQALVRHEEFARRGFRIEAIFDCDDRKVGRKVGRLTVQPASGVAAFVMRRQVDIGVLAVPAEAAQSVADLLIISGIRGLLNLAGMHVVAPHRVAVVDSRILFGFRELAHAIKRSMPQSDTVRRAVP